MNNFKSGSGNLDFGSSDDDENGESNTEPAETQEEAEQAESVPVESASSSSADQASADSESPSVQSASDEDSKDTSTPPAEAYPYFIRRSNVGDERDTRLEIHVRDKVADQEAEFRNKLAEQLGTNEVSKTDAREFALLAAFDNPEQVAKLMREEGFGTLE